jgi:hypothetical protein
MRAWWDVDLMSIEPKLGVLGVVSAARRGVAVVGSQSSKNGKGERGDV